MVELSVSQNNNSSSRSYGLWYPRVAYKQTLTIDDMAAHMAEHNTPFSKGTIAGILKDFVSCVREQCLMGNVVKIENLALFKCGLVGNGTYALYDAETDVTIRAAIGAKTTKKSDGEGGTVDVPTGNSVKSVKLTAQATGAFTRSELKKAVRLGWTDKTAAMIAAAKAAAQGGGGGDDDEGGGGNG